MPRLTPQQRAGRKGGRSRSPKKIAAVRKNAKQGGRPAKRCTCTHTTRQHRWYGARACKVCRCQGFVSGERV